MKNVNRFTIIGGGISGLTTAIALRKIGIKATLFEASPSIKPLGAGLALAANAVKGFQKLGIVDAILPGGRLMDAFVILDEKGRDITRTDSRAVGRKHGIDNFTIHRAILHQALLDQLVGNPIVLGKRAISIDQSGEGIIIRFDDGTVHQTDYLIVADGIHSAIRQQLLPDSKPRYAGYTCWRAVVDVSGMNLDLHEATETWGRNGRVGVVPLAGNKIYWFACVNAPFQDARMRGAKVSDLTDWFSGYHRPIPEIIARTKDENLLWNDIIDLQPLSRYAFGNVLFVGDAAHATTPNMGQGACQAIEDAVVLADELSANDQPAEAFKRFENRRLKRTHYITERSRQIGVVAQIQNPILAALRNGLFRMLPPSLNDRQLETLYKVDF
ncbi:FAD-dependent monooxygenase [Larkinella terrae]|uniref:NAD(P)-binding protein n=1 Tax=Larkinella terrae TaxID=2025311 RepID=A0A7K0EM11_9BACT|nr:FAD-dependent monooxygenase [Larkinella terrae]MRS62571.1 NAD(P)-binding protein [Larkinella terrae]